VIEGSRFEGTPVDGVRADPVGAAAHSLIVQVTGALRADDAVWPEDSDPPGQAGAAPEVVHRGGAKRLSRSS
jgi:hypothetical protein